MTSYKQNYSKETLKNIIKEGFISTDTKFEGGNYTYFPVFDLVFRKLSNKEKKEFSEHQKLGLVYESNIDSFYKKNLGDSMQYLSLDRLIKKKYLSYIDTKKFFLYEIYVFKDSVFFGKVMKYKNEKKEVYYKFNQQCDLSSFYKDTIWKYQPDLMFFVRHPWSNLYFIANGDVMVMEDIGENVTDIDSYVLSNDFNFGKSYIKTSRDIPTISY
jgi:hypothetical protein